MGPDEKDKTKPSIETEGSEAGPSRVSSDQTVKKQYRPSPDVEREQFTATEARICSQNTADTRREEGSDEDEDGYSGDSRRKMSAAMNRTIQQIERLLEEAVKVVEMAGFTQNEDDVPGSLQERPESAARRPTTGIARKISKYLAEASSNSNGAQLNDDRTATTGTLEMLRPEPTAVSLEEKRTKLSRERRKGRGGPSNATDKPLKILEPPQISPRTTSARLPEAVRKKIPARPRPPSIRLNDLELKEEDGEEMDELLSDTGEGHERHFSQIFGVHSRHDSINMAHPSPFSPYKIDLNGVRHVDLAERPEKFDVHSNCHHAPVARNWPNSRKRFAALISCINTACLGMQLGIYAGEVPAIQYVIVDFDRRIILGNVFLYCGLAIPNLVFWPLPLLHGRKPYTLAALALALCLQIPQGLTVSNFRSPDVERYKIILLLSRGLSGLVFGFANINNLGTLLDVFGASLQTSDPQEFLTDPYDVRRHGGGMGLWLAIWSWCTMGSIGVRFLIGAYLISDTSVDWGFWISLILLMAVLLLNVVAPEVRRSAFRRTIAEMVGQGGSFSRVARGEVKLHLTGNGPYWWGEEIKAGLQLSWKMLKQPGFLILSIYAAWVYAQFTLVLMLLGALASTRYRYPPVDVGLCVLSLAVGSALAVPFQRASWLSRSRYAPPRTDSMTFEKAMVWTSHTVRRTLFTLFLPLAAIGYALTSKGPVFPVAVPCIFAGLVAYASNLATSECYSLIMLTFDTSDLQPGMTGRPARRSVIGRYQEQRTNFSSYPRVSAGLAVTQSLKFVFGAVATGIGGRVERRYGSMEAAGIVAGVLMALTLLLTVVLFRWKTVQMIPAHDGRSDDAEDGWEPVILGNPSGLTRKINIFEAGEQTRWSQIRDRNHLTGGSHSSRI